VQIKPSPSQNKFLFSNSCAQTPEGDFLAYSI
jgi:hypothetical protein